LDTHTSPTMSSASYKVPAFRSSGIGGAGNFVKATQTPTITITPIAPTKKSAYIMRGIGGAGNAISRLAVEALPRTSTTSMRPASLHSVSSGHYHGIGGRGNWTSASEKRRNSSETESSLI
jgi:hypothetical protein